MSVLWLTLGVASVGVAWTVAQVRAARADDAPTRRILVALGVYVLLVAIALALGASGVVGRFDRMPPPFAFMFLGLIAASFGIAFSRLGTALVEHTTLPALVAFHGFRVLAELTIHSAYRAGLAPVQMSFEGYNPDMAIALAAPVVALAMRRGASVRLATAWNIAGVLSLVVIAFIAVTSMPTPLRLFHGEPSNAWVTQFPYTLLPVVLVTAALTGHLLVFRKLSWLRRGGANRSA